MESTITKTKFPPDKPWSQVYFLFLASPHLPRFLFVARRTDLSSPQLLEYIVWFEFPQRYKLLVAQARSSFLCEKDVIGTR